VNKLNFSRDIFLKKKKEALAKEASTKVHSFRENFKKRKLEVKADLDETSKIWAELSKKFKWWQSLP